MASQKVRMLAQISGTHDGVDWPQPGGEVTLSEHEAKSLIEAGLARASDAKEPKVETAVAPKAETRRAPARRATKTKAAPKTVAPKPEPPKGLTTESIN